jgi:hypothetical protein
MPIYDLSANGLFALLSNNHQCKFLFFEIRILILPELKNFFGLFLSLVLFCFCFFETGSPYVAQAALLPGT